MKKFAENANTFFGRTLQKTEEAFKTTEKTPLDSNLENLLLQAQKRKNWATQLVTLTRHVIQPNPALRMEDAVLKGFDRTKDRVPDSTQLANCMSSIANELGQSTPHARALEMCGRVQEQLGQAEIESQKAIEQGYIQWLQNYLDTSAKNAATESDNLEQSRLDLDRAKTKLRRTKEGDTKRMTIQDEVNEAQQLFNRQCDVTRQALETSVSEFDQHQNALRTLLQSQLDYYDKCANAIQSVMQ
jgi:flagellar biosynthesis chaperone FliJ